MDSDTRELLGEFAQRIVDEGLPIEDIGEQLKRAAKARSVKYGSDKVNEMALKDHEARIKKLEERLGKVELSKSGDDYFDHNARINQLEDRLASVCNRTAELEHHYERRLSYAEDQLRHIELWHFNQGHRLYGGKRGA